MVKLLPLLLILFVTIPNTSFGQKGKKEVSKIKVFLNDSKTEISPEEIIDRNWIEICKNLRNDYLDKIEIIDNMNSWFNVEIIKGYDVVLKTEFPFKVTHLPKNKIVLQIHPWIQDVDDLNGDYLVKITREKDSDHNLKLNGEEPENEPDDVVDFVIHYRECGD